MIITFGARSALVGGDPLDNTRLGSYASSPYSSTLIPYFALQDRHTSPDWHGSPRCLVFPDWRGGPSPTCPALSPPICGSQIRTGGVSITSGTTSPRIRLVVHAPTPTTPTRPHRPLPVHTSGLLAAPRLIRIATSTAPNTVVSLAPSAIASASVSVHSATRLLEFTRTVTTQFAEILSAGRASS